MELQSEASVFGAPGDGLSNGNVPHLHGVQSASRTAGGPAQTSYALLSQVSWRRTRSHQPHHGPLRGLLDDVIMTPPTERTRCSPTSHVRPG
ncbi:uncharacterized protein si:ch211-221j21.3 isoform X1 [Cyclopterus lumpus]|uniref:uncharacterized protein si:ch211-221j21.3 isoform X1 n=1 Tax=Cyclopterus lumpus TaxID=8103 RepID=UPI001485DCA8|nr:uncharacterized protein si:ch211-221j21.3 isoform X1 [Cyclopterus lumpus]